MDEIAEPLTPPDCELREYPFTPIFRARLFGSSFHARASDAEWRAGVTLWLKSWDQVPSGSLPDDDIDLCRLAELGRDMKTWRKLKEKALHGWVKCTADGRLYHPVVAEGVLEAWVGRRKQSKKGKAGAAARWAKRDGTGNSTGITTATNLHPDLDGTGIAQAMPSDSKGKGKGEKKAAARREDDPGPDRWDGVLAEACRAAGLPESRLVNDFAIGSRWATAGYDPADVLVCIRERAAAPGYKPPRSLGYFTAAIGEYRAARLAAEQAASGRAPWPADMPEPPDAEPLSSDYQRWRARASSYATGRAPWATSVNGPEPGAPGCRMPADLAAWCIPIRHAALEAAA